MKQTPRSLEETAAFAEAFALKLVSAAKGTPRTEALVLGLSGDLGSGKTTFMKSLALALGVRETVASPTFVIEKRYKLPREALPLRNLIHMDAYRLNGPEDLAVLGFAELAQDPSNVIAVEWPERVAEALPLNIFTVRFSFVDETTRQIEIDMQ
jgi:tRNA threonylcarbamoyladenosine biosynthesis protein TsaE